MKQLYTADELIEHMKNKGITFKHISEDEAKEFLVNKNYYMKLSAYRANYEKGDSGSNKGKYIDLDFAYLKELSIIDKRIRYIIVEMCLDIEHELKVKLLNSIESIDEEDGYNIVRCFIEHGNNFKLLNTLKAQRASFYCRDLIEKYYPDFPVWVFVEVISFGTLLYFCKFYEDMYGKKIVDNAFMNIVRDLRNASAHSNCLLNHLAHRIDSGKQINFKISQFVKDLGFSKSSRRNNLNSMFTYNFVTLLYVYDILMPAETRKQRYEQLSDFMNGRVIENKDYFKNNQKITSTYDFINKVICRLYDNVDTTKCEVYN